MNPVRERQKGSLVRQRDFRLSSATPRLSAVRVAVSAATTLTVLSALLSCYSSWQISRLFNSAVAENIPSLRVAEELEIALLEQRGFVASYFLADGSEVWLQELKHHKEAIQEWLPRARGTAHTDTERNILAELAIVYDEYNQRRDEAVELFDRGEREAATRILLNDVHGLARQAHGLCEQFVACNQSYIEAATEGARQRMWRVAYVTASSAVLAIGLGVALLWISVRGLLAEAANRGYEAELLAAQKVQERLLPAPQPAISGIELGAIWDPAEFAAGDYVDFIPSPHGSLFVAIADVSGHGMGPALLSVSTRAYLRAYLRQQLDLGEIRRRLNAAILEDSREQLFVTMLLAELNLANSTLTYVNAGHPSGFVIDAAGEIKSLLDRASMPLGISSDIEFPDRQTVPLAPGDVIVLVTDGILESPSPGGEPFGSRRLIQFVREHRNRSAHQIAECLHVAVREHTQSVNPRDDVTAAVIKVSDRAS